MKRLLGGNSSSSRAVPECRQCVADVLQTLGLLVQNIFILVAFNAGEPLQKPFNRGAVPEGFEQC